MSLNGKKDKGTTIIRVLTYALNNFDSILSVILAFIAIILSRLDPSGNWPATIIATIIGIIAISFLKDRKEREGLKKQMNEVKLALEQIVNRVLADDFFSTKTSEYEIIKKTEKELVLIQETGQLIAETCRQELLHLVRTGGKIRWIVVLPEDNIAHLMSFRNANLGTTELITSRMNNGTRMIKVLASEAKEYAKNIELRYFPYPLDITCVFKDPYHSQHKKRMALVRLQGFRVTYDDKLDFIIDAYYSRSVFELYLKQMENMWRTSTKCIFLTGKPGIGKSTLLRKVVETLSSTNLSLCGFLTNDIKDEDNKRVGFETSEIGTSTSMALAKKRGDNYELNDKAMEEVIIPILEKSIRDKSKILIIDEIGPIQLKNRKFQDLIKMIIEDNNISILGIVAENGHPFLSDIHRNIRTGIIEVDLQNRDTLHETLVLEFAHNRLS